MIALGAIEEVVHDHTALLEIQGADLGAVGLRLVKKLLGLPFVLGALDELAGLLAGIDGGVLHKTDSVYCKSCNRSRGNTESACLPSILVRNRT